MKSSRRYRPIVELLETRYTPAGTVTGSFSQGTWTLIGDADANDITINPGATPGDWTLTGNATAVAGVTNPQNVENIVIKLKGDDDVVTVNDTGIFRTLAGNLCVYGGEGANFVYIVDMTIGKDVKVTNGTNTTGTDEFYLEDSIVRGKVVINNGDGDTETGIYRTTPGVSSVRKGVFVTNGSGYDENYIIDTNIGGDVVFKNGLPDAMNDAGYTEIFNEENDTARSVIKGNVLVVYKGGNVDYDGIWDTEILGDVTFKHKFNDGNGLAQLYIDGYTIDQPVVIHGNLTILHQEQSYIDIGADTLGYLESGLVVGKNLNITTGAQADTLLVHQLRVNKATKISTGAGVDTVEIDDSRFNGPSPTVVPYGFELLTGSGADIVDIETDATKFFATQFARNIKINMGADNDTLTMGFGGDTSRQVELLGKSMFLGGADNDTFNQLNVVAVFGQNIVEDFEV
jgi:hypothetical protein